MEERSDARAERKRLFDAQREAYAPLCFELKLLYVAITRAKGQVVVFESAQAAEPLVKLWQSPLHCRESCDAAELIRISAPGDAQTALAASRKAGGGPSSWSDLGEKMLEQEQYEDALLCFSNANDAPGKACAEAHIAYDKASQLAADAESISDRREALAAILRAADAVARPPSGKLNIALRWCFVAISFLQRWGDRESDGAPYLAMAGFLEAQGKRLEAAEALAAGGLHELAVAKYRQVGSPEAIDKALELCREQFKIGGVAKRDLLVLAAEILEAEARKCLVTATDVGMQLQERADCVVQCAQLVVDKDNEDPAHRAVDTARWALELAREMHVALGAAEKALLRAGLHNADLRDVAALSRAMQSLLHTAGNFVQQKSLQKAQANLEKTLYDLKLNTQTSRMRASLGGDVKTSLDTAMEELTGSFVYFKGRLHESQNVANLAEAEKEAAHRSAVARKEARALAMRFLRLVQPEDKQAQALVSVGFIPELIELETRRGNHRRVAEVYIEFCADYHRAAEAYARGNHYSEAAETLLEFARAGFDFRGSWAQGAPQPAVREALQQAADLLRAKDAAIGKAAIRLRLILNIVSGLVDGLASGCSWSELAGRAVTLGRADLALLCRLRGASSYSDASLLEGRSPALLDEYFGSAEAAVQQLVQLRDGVWRYGCSGSLTSAAMEAKRLLLARDHPRRRGVLVVHAFEFAASVLSASEVEVVAWAAGARAQLEAAIDAVLPLLVDRLVGERQLQRAAKAALLPRTPRFTVRALEILLTGSMPEFRFLEQVLQRDKDERTNLVSPAERREYLARCAVALAAQHRAKVDAEVHKAALHFVELAAPCTPEDAEAAFKQRLPAAETRTALLERCGLLPELIAFECGRGNATRAAEVHKWRPDFPAAAGLYRRAPAPAPAAPAHASVIFALCRDKKKAAEALFLHVRSFFSACGREHPSLAAGEGAGAAVRGKLLAIVQGLRMRAHDGAVHGFELLTCHIYSSDHAGSAADPLRPQLEMLHAALEPPGSVPAERWALLAQQARGQPDLEAFCRRRALLASDGGPSGDVALSAIHALSALLDELPTDAGATPGPAGLCALAAFTTRRCGRDECLALEAGCCLAAAPARAAEAGAEREAAARAAEAGAEREAAAPARAAPPRLLAELRERVLGRAFELGLPEPQLLELRAALGFFV
eukprot:tig00021254_g19690.t1